MRSDTHAVIGMAAYSLAAVNGLIPTSSPLSQISLFPAVIVSVIGSIFPDLDIYIDKSVHRTLLIVY